MPHSEVCCFVGCDAV